VKDSVEGRRIGAVDGWDGGRGRGLGSYGDGATGDAGSTRADVDCPIRVLGEDEGSLEKEGLVMGKDGGESGV